MYLNNDNTKGGNKVNNIVDSIIEMLKEHGSATIVLSGICDKDIEDDKPSDKCDGCPISEVCDKKDDNIKGGNTMDNITDLTMDLVKKKEEIAEMLSGHEVTPEEFDTISQKLRELSSILQKMTEANAKKDDTDDVETNNSDGLSKAVTRAVETIKNNKIPYYDEIDADGKTVHGDKDMEDDAEAESLASVIKEHLKNRAKQKKEIVDALQRLSEDRKNSKLGVDDLSTTVNEKKDRLKRDAAEGLKRLREKTEEVRKKMKNDALGKALLRQTTSALAKSVKEHNEYVKKKEAETLNIHISFDEDFIEALNNIADAIDGDY